MEDVATLLVHPWSGTVIDAEDGVILVNVARDAANAMTDKEIIDYAIHHGLMISGGVSA